MIDRFSADYEVIRKKYKDSASLHQREASNPQISVWVEASAGTGKT